MKNKFQPPRRFKKQREKKFVVGLTGISFFVGLLAVIFGTADFLVPDVLSRETVKLAPDDPGLTGKNAGRGTIYDNSFTVLATSHQTKAVYARPLEVESQEAAAEKLAPILGLNGKELLSTLKAERAFVWLGREIRPIEAEKIAGLNLKGIYLVNEMKRCYPNGQEAAHVVGFATNEQGLDGIEFQYNNLLRAEEINQADLAMLDATTLDRIGTAGLSLILTINLRHQTSIDNWLKSLVKKTGARSGMAALLSPRTGALLALVNLPAFDPNHFWDYTESERENCFLTDVVFPGGMKHFLDQAIDFEKIKDSARKTRDQNFPKDHQITLIPEKHKKKILGRKCVFNHEALARLEGQIDISKKYRIDLPINYALGNKIDETASNNQGNPVVNGTALQLLADFTSLITHDKHLTPHFLAGVRDEATGRVIPTIYNTGKDVVFDPDSDKAVTEIFDGLGKSGPAGFHFLESMLPTSSVESESQGAADDLFVDYTMLGATSQTDPELTMIVVLKHLNLSLLTTKFAADSRLIAGEIGKFIPDLLKIHKESPVGDLPPLLIVDEQKTNKMKKNKQQPVSLGQNLPSLKMPAITGQSLRKGLQALQQYNLRISVIGSGMIVAQHPPPGTLLNKGDSCILKLHVDH